MTCDELLATVRKSKPNVRYTKNRKETAIGAWLEEQGRWVMVAAKTLLDTWALCDREVCVDGKPLIPQEDWVV